MRFNKKALQLIDKGLSFKTVSELTESQINVLHNRLFSEQTMVSRTDTATINKLKTEKKPFEVYEKEIEEDTDVDLTKDPDATDDGMGIFEKDYKDGPNPWAICHAQVGPKKTRKFERCVMAVKKQLKEGKNPLSLFLETQIEKIVERHIPPRITKGDLLKVVAESNSTPVRKTDSIQKPLSPSVKKRETKEQGTAPAPSKPITKPDTRPSTSPKEKPFNPGKNPFPKEHPAPKASKVSPEDAKEKVIDVIMKILEK
jgi:hypothetical protein